MKYLNLLYAAGLLLLATACEKDLPKFSDEEGLLIFYYGDNLTTDQVTSKMGRGSHSFKLNSSEEQTRDTVWIKVNTIGKLSTNSRPLVLQQVPEADVNNAVVGKHYVDFEDPTLADLYQIPAKQNEALIPVVVLRDPSLETDGDVVLKITFKDNGYFKAGYPEFATYTLTISDRLARPNMWDELYLEYDFGAYGPQKHELMIKWSGNAWDDTYIQSLATKVYYPGYGEMWQLNDGAYLTYLSGWFSRKLAEENAERLANGKDVYREADGTEVDFTPSGWGY